MFAELPPILLGLPGSLAAGLMTGVGALAQAATGFAVGPVVVLFLNVWLG